MPQQADLERVLQDTCSLWEAVKSFVLEACPEGLEEWNYPGPKFGWSFRIKDKKRAIVYLLPREGYFKVAFVFGEKAFNEVLKSNVNQSIKDDLIAARPYMEGRGIRIPVHTDSDLMDVKLLIQIKLNR